MWTNLRPAMGISRGPGKIRQFFLSATGIRNGQNPSENMDNNDNKPQMPIKNGGLMGKPSGRMGEFAKGHVSENRWVSILVECKPGVHLSLVYLQGGARQVTQLQAGLHRNPINYRYIYHKPYLTIVNLVINQLGQLGGTTLYYTMTKISSILFFLGPS